MGVYPEEPKREPPKFRDLRIPKYPVIVKDPNSRQIIDNFNQHDYNNWATISVLFFPLGYFFGKRLGKNVAFPAMWFMGAGGLIGGFALGYQNSQLRLQGFIPNDGEVAKYSIKENCTEEQNTEHMYKD